MKDMIVHPIQMAQALEKGAAGTVLIACVVRGKGEGELCIDATKRGGGGRQTDRPSDRQTDRQKNIEAEAYREKEGHEW